MPIELSIGNTSIHIASNALYTTVVAKLVPVAGVRLDLDRIHERAIAYVAFFKARVR